MESSFTIRIGFYLPDNIKKREVNKRLLSLLRKSADVVEIKTLEENINFESFNSVFHKLTAELNSEDRKTQEWAIQFHKNLLRFKNVFSIDNPLGIEIMANRVKLHNIMKDFNFIYDEKGINYSVKWPKGIVLTPNNFSINEQQLKDNNLHFPIIIKPGRSCGSDFSHKLIVVFTFEQLSKTITSYFSNLPSSISSSLNNEEERYSLLLQQVISHNSYIYKIYTIYNEGVFQKIDSSFNLKELLEKKIEYSFNSLTDHEKLKMEDAEKLPPLLLEKLSNELHEKFNLYLFGFDLIKDEDDKNTLYIVDINYYPSYNGVEKAEDIISAHILTRIKEFLKSTSETIPKT